jgi:hypothetical protein
MCDLFEVGFRRGFLFSTNMRPFQGRHFGIGFFLARNMMVNKGFKIFNNGM